MQIFRDPKLLQSYITTQRFQSKKIGLVPTMGALHRGHAALIRESLKTTDITICTIYVNPIQFSDQQDLKNYPRQLDQDLEFLRALNCHAVFCPSDEVMYPSKPILSMALGRLENIMEGRYRPGHFKGVALVVSKLFHMVQPEVAYFGEKDWQQLVIIRQLVEDLSFPVEIVGVPVVRESDGLALSSRNQRLTESDRSVAPQLYHSLLLVRTMLEKRSSIETAGNAGVEYLARFPSISLEYLEIVTAHELDRPTSELGSEPLSICVAAFLGEIRLIDNMQVFD